MQAIFNHSSWFSEGKCPKKPWSNRLSNRENMYFVGSETDPFSIEEISYCCYLMKNDVGFEEVLVE